MKLSGLLNEKEIHDIFMNWASHNPHSENGDTCESCQIKQFFEQNPDIISLAEVLAESLQQYNRQPIEACMDALILGYGLAYEQINKRLQAQYATASVN